MIILLVLLDTATGGTGFWASIPAGTWAIIGTAVGAAGLKILEKWLNRNKEGVEIRRDVVTENNDLYKRVDEIEAEVTQWRQRYYRLEESLQVHRNMLLANGLEPPAKPDIPPNMGN